VRHRQAAARAGFRQRGQRRHASVPQSLGPHRPSDVAARRGQSWRAGPAPDSQRVADCAVSLYSHYREEDEGWKLAGHRIPPVFIVVCNNTANSKLIYEWISGWEREVDGVPRTIHRGHLALFSNYDQEGNPLSRMNTLLIDSRQIESGEAIDPAFRRAAEAEIDQFRREKAQREGAAAVANVSDEDLLREVMNTVGKEGRLGEQIRCVVSVSMLTEAGTPTR
jgi:type III restriction enzyme